MNEGMRRRRSGAPSPSQRRLNVNPRSPSLSQKTSSPPPSGRSSSIRRSSPSLSQKLDSPSSASTRSISNVRISRNNSEGNTRDQNGAMFSRENLELLSEEDADQDKMHMLLNGTATSPWFAYYESTTGRPVYYNEITEEKTWELPKHASITWVDEDSIDGEKCPTYDPENLGEDYLDTPWRKPSVQAARHSHSRKVSLGGKASLFTPILDIDDVGPGVQTYFFFLRSTTIIFWILSIIVVPLIVTNTSGSRIPPSSMDYLWMPKRLQ